MTEHKNPTPDYIRPTPRSPFDAETDAALAIARYGGPSSPARIAEEIMRADDKLDAIRDTAIRRQGEAAGYRRGEIAGRKNARRMTAIGFAIGAATGIAGTEAINNYSESHTPHVVYEGVASVQQGGTPIQAVAELIEDYMNTNNIDLGNFPSQDVNTQSNGAATEWKNLTGNSQVQAGASFEVVLSADDSGNYSVEVEPLVLESAAEDS